MTTESELNQYLVEQCIFDEDEQEVQRVLQLIRFGALLTNIYRNSIYPQWNDTGVMDATYSGEFAAMSTARLFRMLDIPDERLKEVYLFDNLSKHGAIGYQPEETGFTGEFAPNGKQNLANILGKPVQFYHQPHSEPILDVRSREVFTPQP